MKYIKVKTAMAGLAAAAVSVAGLTIAGATPTSDINLGNDNPHNKVTLCHATGSQTNPFVEIVINANGAVNGHSGHSSDIIPPFTYHHKGHTLSFPGLNWDATGQAILRNNCVPVTTNTGGQGSGGGQGVTNTVNNTTNLSGGLGAGTPSASAPQVLAPVGSVNAGAGGTPSHLNTAAVAGLSGSAISMAGGALLMRRKFF